MIHNQLTTLPPINAIRIGRGGSSYFYRYGAARPTEWVTTIRANRFLLPITRESERERKKEMERERERKQKAERRTQTEINSERKKGNKIAGLTTISGEGHLPTANVSTRPTSTQRHRVVSATSLTSDPILQNSSPTSRFKFFFFQTPPLSLSTSMTLRPQPGTFHPLSTNANDFYPPSPPPPINRFEMIYRYTKIVIQFSFFICKIRDSANDNGKLYSEINWKKKTE